MSKRDDEQYRQFRRALSDVRKIVKNLKIINVSSIDFSASASDDPGMPQHKALTISWREWQR